MVANIKIVLFVTASLEGGIHSTSVDPYQRWGLCFYWGKVIFTPNCTLAHCGELRSVVSLLTKIYVAYPLCYYYYTTTTAATTTTTTTTTTTAAAYYYYYYCCCCCCCYCYYYCYYYYIWVLIFISKIFKNVLLATRKSHRRINDELVMHAKTRLKPVSAVHYSTYLTYTPNHHQLADFCSHGTRVRVKLPSNQVTAKHPNHILNTHFYIFFKLCGPASDLLAHYGPHAPLILTCLCHSHSLASAEHITFETCNEIIDV